MEGRKTCLDADVVAQQPRRRKRPKRRSEKKSTEI